MALQLKTRDLINNETNLKTLAGMYIVCPIASKCEGWLESQSITAKDGNIGNNCLWRKRLVEKEIESNTVDYLGKWIILACAYKKWVWERMCPCFSKTNPCFCVCVISTKCALSVCACVCNGSTKWVCIKLCHAEGIELAVPFRIKGGWLVEKQTVWYITVLCG